MSRPSGGPAMQPQLRRTTHANHFDIAPEHPLGMSGPEGLHRRLFGSEAAGQMGGRIPPAGGIRDLAFSEHTTKETIAESGDGCLDAIDFCGIHPDTDNIHAAYDPAKA